MYFIFRKTFGALKMYYFHFQCMFDETDAVGSAEKEKQLQEDIKEITDLLDELTPSVSDKVLLTMNAVRSFNLVLNITG